MLAQTYIHISDLVMSSAKTLEERLADLLKIAGGRKTLPDSVQIYDIHNFNGFSGLNYWVDGTLVGQLQLATLTNGSYAFYKRIYLESEITEIYDYYDQSGQFIYSSEQLDGQVIYYNSINMDPTSPFANHLYNILQYEYDQAKSGYSQTRRIVFIETMLAHFLANPETFLSVEKMSNDPALKNIEKEILRIEKDPVLKWEERQAIFQSLKEVRERIIATKQRAHRISSLQYTLPLLLNDIKVKAQIFKQRPASNIRGTLYKYTLGNLIWFAKTVKDNLGYSVALAIYGPFTFYFITQPMNPHAMWAVGKVRNAYIQTVQQIENVMGDAHQEKKKVAEIQNSQDQVSDEVTSKQAGTKKQNIAQLPISKESWEERMSNFKAMQIAYEGNMVFAARLGRIEQMENQFSFPLTAESAWRELERYNNTLNATVKYNTNLDSRFKSFLQNEIKRSAELQVYIWKKMAQFFLDHPYIVVDQADEQTQKDYYVGKSFIFMQEMTEKLSKTNLAQMPKTHAKVQALAKFYQQTRKQGRSVIDTLKQNSKLFNQKDLFGTMELRSYMKRHWEILFLQQNKKQEASSFGLQAYTWSIKNALWAIQSIVSAKREELGTLAYKFNLNNQNTNNIKADKNIDELLGSLMHMMAIEYVSIKEEFSKNLKNDTEATQREEVINNIKQYLVERDKLFNSTLQVANKEAKAATTI